MCACSVATHFWRSADSLESCLLSAQYTTGAVFVAKIAKLHIFFCIECRFMFACPAYCVMCSTFTSCNKLVELK